LSYNPVYAPKKAFLPEGETFFLVEATDRLVKEGIYNYNDDATIF